MGEESLDCGDRGESSHSGPFSPTDRVFLTCSSVMKALRSMFSPALLRRQAYVYSDLMSALVTSRLSRLPTRLFPFFLSSSLPSTNLFVGLLGQAGRAHSVVHKGRRIPEAIPLRALNSKSVLSRESSKLHALVESLRGLPLPTTHPSHHHTVFSLHPSQAFITQVHLSCYLLGVVGVPTAKTDDAAQLRTRRAEGKRS